MQMSKKTAAYCVEMVDAYSLTSKSIFSSWKQPFLQSWHFFGNTVQHMVVVICQSKKIYVSNLVWGMKFYCRPWLFNLIINWKMFQKHYILLSCSLMAIVYYPRYVSFLKYCKLFYSLEKFQSRAINEEYKYFT